MRGRMMQRVQQVSVVGGEWMWDERFVARSHGAVILPAFARGRTLPARHLVLFD
jgi:hypothetical protein